MAGKVPILHCEIKDPSNPGLKKKHTKPMKDQNNQLTPLSVCEDTSRSTFMLSVYRCWFFLQLQLGRVRNWFWNLAGTVRRSIQTSPSANQLQLLSTLAILNRRKVFGLTMLALAVLSIFGHRLFLDMYSEPHDVCRVIGFSGQCYNRADDTGWCYTSWYWYWYEVKYCVAAIFGSVALILIIPRDRSLSFIVASLLMAWGWTFFLHYTFFSINHETINAVPSWQMIVIGLSLGFGLVMSADHLIHFYNHRTLAIEKRLGTLYNGLQVLTGDEFKEQYRKFYEEKQAFQKEF